MEFKAYHKIRQFKDIVRDVQHQANFKGLDDENNPIYENSEKPILRFKGTVKLHGTNAGISYRPEEGIVAQKRGSLIDKEHLANSHFGFNQFVQVTKKQELKDLMESLWSQYCNENEQITLYGEWAGEGVQKSVGISNHEKSFFFFDCKIYNLKTETEKWIDISQLKVGIDRVYNIHDFPTYEIDIDFNTPALQQNDLIKLTTKVEELCPVAKKLGHEGIGEGIVWTCYWKSQKYIFKVKGEKHSTTKVKKLASVDPEVLNSVNEFVEYACTKNRIEQGIIEVNATEKKHMPDLLRWVANDIISEEDKELTANNLEWKQVAREVSNRVRQYYFTKLDSL